MCYNESSCRIAQSDYCTEKWSIGPGLSPPLCKINIRHLTVFDPKRVPPSLDLKRQVFSKNRVSNSYLIRSHSTMINTCSCFVGIFIGGRQNYGYEFTTNGKSGGVKSSTYCAFNATSFTFMFNSQPVKAM